MSTLEPAAQPKPFKLWLSQLQMKTWAQTGYCVAIYLVDLAVSAAISDRL